MNYGKIKYNDIANGLGIRTTLFVSGCRNKCKGCFQPETWDFNYGKEFTKEEEDNIINSMIKNEYINGLTLLGGDPFETENVKVLLPFLKRFKQKCPDKNIWCYTGYYFEDLKNNKDNLDMLCLLDVLIDGPYIEEQNKIGLIFRGSENQRIINVQDSLKSDSIIIIDIF